MAWKNMSTIAPEYSLRGLEEKDKVSEVPRSATIAVAGAGAFGGWTALHLLRRGYQVTLFDPWGAGNSLSSSGGETRLMRCVYGGNSFYSKLALDSFDMWLEAEQWEQRSLLQATGCLWLAGQNDSELQMAAKVMDGLRLPYEVYTPVQGASKFPYVNTKDLSYLLLEGKAGVLKARESCQAVLRRFVAEGGRYVPEALYPCAVVNGEMQNCTTSAAAKHVADIYLFASGPWLKQLFPEVVGRHLTVTRQEVHYFGSSAQTAGSLENGLPAWIDMSTADGYYGIPGGLSRGFKIASDSRGREIDPTTENRMPEAGSVEKARQYLHHRFPGLGSMPLVESRVCQYTNTPDGSFMLDRHPEAHNVWLLGGGSGHGFKHGPALGRLAAGVVTGTQGLPALLSLDRLM